MDKAMTDVLKYKRKTFLFVFLAIALVLATWYRLKVQGITLTEDISYEEVLICENAEESHVHSEGCYEKVAVISSDKQNEIDNTTEEQTTNTTDTNLDENSQETNSQEISEDNEETDTQETFENNQEENQEEIPEDTEQTEIANDINNNEIMLAAGAATVYTLSEASSATTYALGDTSTSTSKVNVYMYIDGSWQAIGYVDRGSYRRGRTTYYTISSENIINLIKSELGITISASDIGTLYYTNNSNYTRTTLNNGTYDLGTSNTQRNIYITASLTNSSVNQSQLTSGNTFKVYSIKEYNSENVLQSTQYVYTTTGTATYQLSSDYNYYVNGSADVISGGTTINITGATTLKQTPAEKCTITIKYANSTQTAVQVIKGGTYTLDSHLKWKVGDATKLTDGGTKITVNEDITIEEVNQITIIYTVDTSTTATGLNAKYLYDGISIPTVQGSSSYTTTVAYDAGTITEKLSDNYVTPYDSSETVSKDRIVISFRGWKVNSTSTELQAEQTLTWDELYSYAENGVIKLSTVWKSGYENYEHVNFYINYTSEAVDTDGNVETGRTKSNYTPSLWASYVGNATNDKNPIADTTEDNSFIADKNIRALEGDKGNGSRFIYSFPDDEYIIEQLKEKYSENLSIDGQTVDVNELDLEHYAVRWYVFKLENGCWHIDGKLVRKEGKMVITKTFTGSKSAIETVTGYSFEEQARKNNTSYCINVTGGNTDLNLYTGTNSSPLATITDNTTEVDGVTTYLLTYTWVIDIKYGINYTITEQNYNVDKYITNAAYNIVDPESTKYQKVYKEDGSYYYKTDTNGNFVPIYTNQSKATTDGTTAIVIGVNNYAIDSTEVLDTSNLLTVNFSNTYAPTSAITIKKQDSVTNNGLAGAKFSLFILTETTVTKEDGTTEIVESIDETSPLKFTYNESIYTYNVNGNITEITSPTGGSIIIDGLPTGKYKLKEMTVPDGYDGNSSVEVTLSTAGSNVTVEAITKGTGTNNNTNKVLELENASKLGQVKVTKAWTTNVPEEYLTSTVTVQLYLNGRPLSSYDLDNDGRADNDLSKMQVELSQANSWSYTWDNLPLTIDGAEAKYSVVEVKIGTLNAVTTGKNNEDGTWQSYDAYTQYRAYTTAQKTVTNGNVTTVEFQLINDFHYVKIDINKVSVIGRPISDVTFGLYKIDESGNRILISEATTLEDGKITFKDLEYDTKYVLVETKANQGYYLDSTEIYVMIKKSEQQGDADQLIIYTSENFETEAQESDYAENGYYKWVSLNIDEKTGESSLNIINIAHTPMPKAGGSGVYSFYILGILLMGCSTIIIYLRKNKIKKGR